MCARCVVSVNTSTCANTVPWEQIRAETNVDARYSPPLLGATPKGHPQGPGDIAPSRVRRTVLHTANRAGGLPAVTWLRRARQRAVPDPWGPAGRRLLEEPARYDPGAGPPHRELG